MAAPKLILRALELREAAPLRERRPAQLFTKRLEHPRRILALVESHAESDETKYEARRLYVVSLATAFEVYWREFFRFSLDRYRPSDSQVSHFTKVSLTLADVATVLGRKLTFGELVSCAFSFRGAEALNAAASSMLQIDAFTAFRSESFSIEVVRRKTDRGRVPKPTVYPGVQILRSAMPQLVKCYEIRNEVVHNLGNKHRLIPRDLFEIEGQMSTFNIFFSLFLEVQLELLFGKGDA